MLWWRGIGISLNLANSEIFFDKVLYPDFAKSIFIGGDLSGSCLSSWQIKHFDQSAFQLNIWDIIYNTLQSISLFSCFCLFVFHIFVFDYWLLCRKEFGFVCLLRRSRAQIGRSVLFVRKTNMRHINSRAICTPSEGLKPRPSWLGSPALAHSVHSDTTSRPSTGRIGIFLYN
jgi:hypothetical protein